MAMTYCRLNQAMAKEESVTPEGADNKRVTQTYRNADNTIGQSNSGHLVLQLFLLGI